jgi:DNA-binding CsgD family transcriptional regulator
MSETFLYLSPREKQLLRRFARGKTDARIAGELGDKESRIVAQRARLEAKLQIKTFEQLQSVARELANWPERGQAESVRHSAESERSKSQSQATTLRPGIRRSDAQRSRAAKAQTTHVRPRSI